MKTLSLNKLSTSLIMLAIVSACGTTPPTSPITVSASIFPEPIVGNSVNLEIKVSTTQDAPNTKVQVYLPPQIQLIQGADTWTIDIPANETVVTNIAIQVTTPGDWVLDIAAFSQPDPNQPGGFGGAKRLYINSTLNSASVIDDTEYIQPTIPARQVDTGTSVPTNKP